MKSVLAKSFKREIIAFFSESEYHAGAYGRQHRAMAIILARVDVAQMHLNKRLRRNGGDSVVQSDGIVCVSTGVNNASVVAVQYGVNGVHKLAFDIGLKKSTLAPSLSPRALISAFMSSSERLPYISGSRLPSISRFGPFMTSIFSFLSAPFETFAVNAFHCLRILSLCSCRFANYGRRTVAFGYQLAEHIKFRTVYSVLKGEMLDLAAVGVFNFGK